MTAQKTAFHLATVIFFVLWRALCQLSRQTNFDKTIIIITFVLFETDFHWNNVLCVCVFCLSAHCDTVDIPSEFCSKRKRKPTNTSHHLRLQLLHLEHRQTIQFLQRWFRFLFAEISALQTISKAKNVRGFLSIACLTVAWNALYYLRGDEFSSRCSLSLWWCRADARVKLNECAIVCASVLYAWMSAVCQFLRLVSPQEYVENVNNFNIRWNFIFAFIPVSNYHILHSSVAASVSKEKSQLTFYSTRFHRFFFSLQIFPKVYTKEPKNENCSWNERISLRSLLFLSLSIRFDIFMCKMRSPSHLLCKLKWMNIFLPSWVMWLVYSHFQICIGSALTQGAFRRHWIGRFYWFSFTISQSASDTICRNCCATKSNIRVPRPYLALFLSHTLGNLWAGIIL